MKKIPFIMISGGLDSTYLLYTMLKRHKEVVVVNSTVLSNPCITARQDAAVRNILNKMEEFHREGKVIGRVIRVIPISIPGVSLGLSRVPMSVWWGAVGTAVIDDSTENFYLGYVKGDRYAYTIGRNSQNKPEFYIDVSSDPSSVVGVLMSIPHEYDSKRITVGKVFNHRTWINRHTGEKTNFLLDVCSEKEIYRMLGARRRASDRGELFIPPIKIVIAGADNKFTGEYAGLEIPTSFSDPSIKEDEFVLTAEEARKIYDARNCPEFTTLSDFYRRMKILVENGAYEAQLHVDSSAQREEVTNILLGQGYCVERTGDATINVSLR